MRSAPRGPLSEQESAQLGAAALLVCHRMLVDADRLLEADSPVTAGGLLRVAAEELGKAIMCIDAATMAPDHAHWPTWWERFIDHKWKGRAWLALENALTPHAQALSPSQLGQAATLEADARSHAFYADFDDAKRTVYAPRDEPDVIRERLGRLSMTAQDFRNSLGAPELPERVTVARATGEPIHIAFPDPPWTLALNVRTLAVQSSRLDAP